MRQVPDFRVPIVESAEADGTCDKAGDPLRHKPVGDALWLFVYNSDAPPKLCRALQSAEVGGVQ